MLNLILPLLLFFLSCVEPKLSDTEVERQTAASSIDGWTAAGLPDGCVGGMHLERFQIRFADPDEFARLCYPATSDTANGCFKWRLQKHRAQKRYSIEYPEAVVDEEDVLTEAVPGLAIHELMHAFVDRCLSRPYNDPWDYNHTDARVFPQPTLEDGTPDPRNAHSAEILALEALASTPM